MKKIVLWLLTLSILFSVSAVPALAAVDFVAASTQVGDSARAEETIWYVRYVDGQRQRRLWSRTYERWLTDWMDWPED